MLRFLIRRLVFLFFVLLGTTVLVFWLSQIAPSDPARAALGLYATEESVERYRHERGLDRPIHEQYAIYMRSLLRGDLGVSILTGRPVIAEIGSALPATIELIIPSLLFATLIGVSLGIVAAVAVNRWPDYIARIVAVLGMSMPIFWLGVILQIVFFARLRLLPIGRRIPSAMIGPPQVTGLITVDALLAGQPDIALEAAKHLILPAITLSLVNLATLARITRSTLLDVLFQQYILVARSKGLSKFRVLVHHAIPNALIPLVTIVGLMIGQSLGGAIIVETIFQWPGIGRQVVNALIQLDVPVVTAFALLIGFGYGITNLLVDISYFALDPRIRASWHK